MASPDIDWFVGSNPWYEPGGRWAALDALRAVTTRVPPTVTNKVHHVERIEKSFARSARHACRSPYRLLRGAGATVIVVTALLPYRSDKGGVRAPPGAVLNGVAGELHECVLE